MQFRKQDGTLITEQQLRAEHVNVSFPAVLDQYSLELAQVEPVLNSPQPQNTDPLKVVQFGGAVKDTLGNWVQKWDLVDRFATPEAAQAFLDQEFLNKKALKLKQIETKRKELEAAGLPFEFSDGPGTIQTRNDIDIRNIQAVVTTAMIIKQSGSSQIIPFRDQEDQIHIMSADEVISMAMNVQMFISSTYQWSWGKKAALAATVAGNIDSFEV